MLWRPSFVKEARIHWRYILGDFMRLCLATLHMLDNACSFYRSFQRDLRKKAEQQVNLNCRLANCKHALGSMLLLRLLLLLPLPRRSLQICTIDFSAHIYIMCVYVCVRDNFTLKWVRLHSSFFIQTNSDNRYGPNQYANANDDNSYNPATTYESFPPYPPESTNPEDVKDFHYSSSHGSHHTEYHHTHSESSSSGIITNYYLDRFLRSRL